MVSVAVSKVAALAIVMLVAVRVQGSGGSLAIVALPL